MVNANLEGLFLWEIWLKSAQYSLRSLSLGHFIKNISSNKIWGYRWHFPREHWFSPTIPGVMTDPQHKAWLKNWSPDLCFKSVLIINHQNKMEMEPLKLWNN